MVGLKQTDGARIQLDRVSLQGIRGAEVIKELNDLLGSLPQGSDCLLYTSPSPRDR